MLDNLVETISDSVQKPKSVSFFEEETSSSVTARFNRLFGRQKPVHHLLGGGKCRIVLFLFHNHYQERLSATNIFYSQCAAADVLLWRNKKISASVLMGATAIWVLFEWLNYHFLTIVCFALVLGMLAQFFWVNISGLFNRYKTFVCFGCLSCLANVILCHGELEFLNFIFFYIVTDHHQKFPALFCLQRYLLKLAWQLVLMLMKLWGYFRTLHVEEIWNNFLWYVELGSCKLLIIISFIPYTCILLILPHAAMPLNFANVYVLEILLLQLDNCNKHEYSSHFKFFVYVKNTLCNNNWKKPNLLQSLKINANTIWLHFHYNWVWVLCWKVFDVPIIHRKGGLYLYAWSPVSITEMLKHWKSIIISLFFFFSIFFGGNLS